MKKLLLASACCLALTACATPYEWVKAGTTTTARDADRDACAGRTSHLAKDDTEAVTIVDQCMRERGYEKQRK